MFNPLVSDKYKLICFWNAKCACGTIKTWFLNLHGTYDWDYSPHAEVSKHSTAITKHSLSESPYKDYYKFVVVRNPWKRLVSYYKNKKILMRHKNLNWPIERGVPRYSGDITFREMVNLISTIPTDRREDHIINQHHGLGGIVFDEIVKIENFDADMSVVSKRLNLPVDFDFNTTYHFPPSPVSASQDYVFDKKPLDFDHENLPSYEYFYNDELINTVKESYKDDIEAFNFKFLD